MSDELKLSLARAIHGTPHATRTSFSPSQWAGVERAWAWMEAYVTARLARHELFHHGKWVPMEPPQDQPMKQERKWTDAQLDAAQELAVKFGPGLLTQSYVVEACAAIAKVALLFVEPRAVPSVWISKLYTRDGISLGVIGPDDKVLHTEKIPWEEILKCVPPGAVVESVKFHAGTPRAVPSVAPAAPTFAGIPIVLDSSVEPGTIVAKMPAAPFAPDREALRNTFRAAFSAWYDLSTETDRRSRDEVAADAALVAFAPLLAKRDALQAEVEKLRSSEWHASVVSERNAALVAFERAASERDTALARVRELEAMGLKETDAIIERDFAMRERDACRMRERHLLAECKRHKEDKADLKRKVKQMEAHEAQRKTAVVDALAPMSAKRSVTMEEVESIVYDYEINGKTMMAALASVGIEVKP